MMTRSMKVQLKAMGIADEKVRAMTPEQAWRVLNPPKEPEMDQIKEEIKQARRKEVLDRKKKEADERENSTSEIIM